MTKVRLKILALDISYFHAKFRLTWVGYPIFASNNILSKQKYLEEDSSCLYNSPQTDLYGASIDLSYRSVVNIGNRKAIFILDSPKEEQLGLNEQQRLKRKKTESIYNFFPPQPLNFYTFHTFPYMKFVIHLPTSASQFVNSYTFL